MTLREPTWGRPRGPCPSRAAEGVHCRLGLGHRTHKGVGAWQGKEIIAGSGCFSTRPAPGPKQVSWRGGRLGGQTTEGVDRGWLGGRARCSGLRGGRLRCLLLLLQTLSTTTTTLTLGSPTVCKHLNTFSRTIQVSHLVWHRIEMASPSE